MTQFWLVLSLALAGGLPVAHAAEVPGSDREAFSRPMAGLNDDERAQFVRGRSLFNQSWVVAPARDSDVDGLGPLYNRLACVSCHSRNGRGLPPQQLDERMLAMLVRLSVPGQGPHGGPRPHPAYGEQFNEEGIPGVPGEGRISLHWRRVEHRLANGERRWLRAPQLRFAELAYGPLGQVLISPRVGQQMVGMGLLDAVPADTLLARAAQAKPDGVRGRVNQVWSISQSRLTVGRFGHKANMADLREQIAGAFMGDLGITSPLHPQENCTSVQTACQRAPSGGTPELDDGQLEAVTFYLAHLEPPAPRPQPEADVRRGQTLFARAGCAVCHLPSLRIATHATYPRLAGRELAAYTDLLLHDMGPGLADGRPDFAASGREWRTAPLWGIGLTRIISEGEGYLHDGRARTLEEAVLWHDGEARRARLRFEGFSAAERAALLRFVASR